MAAERLVVVGADAAGMSAASQARKRRGSDELAITAFERGRFTSYSACGIPYWIGTAVDDRDDLVVRTPEEFASKQDIEVRIRTEVEEIDLDRGVVHARELETGRRSTEPFDALVIATGARPVRPDLPGIDAEGVHGVQTLDDGEALRGALERGAKRAVVVGGGYIGVELAEAMVVRGLDVTLVEMAEQPMSTLDRDMGANVAEAMRREGITVRTGERVTGVETDSAGRVRAVATEAETLETDVVVLGLGVQPDARLAQAAGVPLGVTGGVLTDLRMKTHREGVWAAGDCVQTFHRVSRAPTYVPLGTHANKQGRVVGINLGGGYATFPGIVGTAVSKVCNVEIARTGLRERDCRDVGFEYVTASVQSTTKAGYFPGAEAITVKLLAEKRSGRLLGGQLVGSGEGSAKRIDALATALWNEMTVEEMVSLDLGYAPPFAPVWDPILIAARKAWDAVEADIQDRH
jgi:NADPH-dependent 2,4-dienoyl-CoA reductase/sulfur reductase-like enzyme